MLQVLTRTRNLVELGSELSGVVAAVGPGVTGFQPGDEVYGVGRSTFAQYATAAAASLARKPVGATHAQAGAVPTSGVTALQAVRNHGRLLRRPDRPRPRRPRHRRREYRQARPRPFAGRRARHRPHTLLSRFTGQRFATFWVAKPTSRELEALTEMIESGQVTPAVQRTRPLTDVVEAMHALEHGTVTGKIVLVP